MFWCIFLIDAICTLPMNNKEIRSIYRDIFQSFERPCLEKHIQKILELDEFLPYNSTFFCITNTQDLSFEYVSKNMTACLGLDTERMHKEGMHYFWGQMHPDDIPIWLQAMNELMAYTLTEIPVDLRQRMSYTWNYRLKNGSGTYVNIIQNTTPLEFDLNMKPIIGLAHYTILHQDIKLPITATAKYLNETNAYETKYFNNFSEKLLDDGISNRERDIIRLLVQHHSSKDIGKMLNISIHTVNTHRRNILKKLKISTTGELVGMLKAGKVGL